MIRPVPLVIGDDHPCSQLWRLHRAERYANTTFYVRLTVMPTLADLTH